MHVLILDNYDSFTYNLAHLVQKQNVERLDIALNDKIALEDINKYDKILLSPGPGVPSEAGIMPTLLQHYSKTKSILGICLGLQAIGEAFGCHLKNLEYVFHGLATPIHLVAYDTLFAGCPTGFRAGRYHSWVIDETKINNNLQVTATDEHGYIMAIKHKHYDVKGVQFHPESILSEHGEIIIKNWLYGPK